MKIFKAILEIIKQSKLPTILIIVVLLYFSYTFIKGESIFSYSVATGLAIGLVALLFVIFSYADYRAREKIDHILLKYKEALNNISSTHSKYEREQRSTIASDGKDSIGSQKQGKGYTVESSSQPGTASDHDEL